MATVTLSGTYTLRLLDLNIDLGAQTAKMAVGFQDSGGIHTVRLLTVKTDLSVTDDLGRAYPAAPTSFKNAITGGGANGGMVPEANSYIATNAASFVI